MNSTFSLLLVFLARFFMPRHNAQMRLLKAQIHILRARIPAQRIILLTFPPGSGPLRTGILHR